MESEPLPPGQYSLSQTPPAGVPSGFRSRSLGEWTVVFDANFDVIRVTAGGDQIGLVFGTALDLSGRTVGGDLDLGEAVKPTSESFEGVLRELLGRYIGLVDAADGRFLYPDPAGALPVIYDETGEHVAASPIAIPSIDHESHFRADFFEEVKWPLISRGENTWLPGRLTYYEGVSQLLPNHRLDLDEWEPTRFWPTGDGEPTASGPDEEVANIVAELERAFDVIGATYDRPKLSLTAGKDSRSLLATSRRLATSGDMSYFTLGKNDRDVDVHVARRLARIHDIDWQSIQITEATEAEQDRWLKRTGYTVGSGIKEIHPTMQTLDMDAEIGGLGGEIGRGYYWEPSDDRDTTVGPTELLHRFHKPEHPKLVTELDRWCREVDHFDMYTMLDLAYQEHRLGCWGSPQHLGFAPEVDYLRPLWYRPVVESMHRLPPKVRRRDELPTRIVAAAWPELNELPYNSFIGWKKYLTLVTGSVERAKTAVANPDVAVEYLTRQYVRR